MKIKRIETAVIQGNYDWTLVRVYTDNEYGTGECFFSPGLTAVIRDLAPLLIGEDPRDVDRLWYKMRWAISPSGSTGGTAWHAISGIEAALWDLVGKIFDIPVYQLFGGKYRDKIRIYMDCHAGESLEALSNVLLPVFPEWGSKKRSTSSEINHPAHGRAYGQPDVHEVFTPEMYAKRAREAVDMGFTAIKFDLDVPNPYTYDTYNGALNKAEIQFMTSLVEAVRTEVGDHIDIGFDCHWRYNVQDAIRLAHALEPYDIAFLEDPVPPENIEAQRIMSQAVKTTISSGENRYLRSGFREILEGHALGMIAPDIQKVGGLLEAKRIADMADTYYVNVAPHNISSPIGTFASCHVAASIPNFFALEFHAADVPFWNDLILGADEPVIKNGYIHLSDKPGIGIELNEEVAKKYAKPGELWFGEKLT
ncbi:mandelate racemase/muconate lactonizing enzyme family protein [Geobacillus thermodenitrificans]|jgi:gluconate/galactonate dehydratase|uniref:Mandelate racemase/muconate lactonizing enzyme family protein n=1 Tax=Geobacillus thermodenitrificans TaxID=33940 RepID=A0ABY9QDI8_GEOTD|nr:mandelate racemase/muconate lactonizing enzyme family protein [Geobacillus thermodenitrificans]MED3716324.1 mandelate racemase/muconate lactonizing enzyme family protein [Geobacillus thermodenitrificans]MED3905941.1 mandelate racemase/muconate lactonizing enzyme family protein [Geobacillus thermodenitrificans]WMV76621.1 mandelate racemase/muconate lactonizing enzyme family protein [Geobacillus thermodenitrificans]